MANKVDLAHLQAIADAMAGGTNQAVSDEEGDKEYEQTMDYREMMKNQANQAIDENFGDELVIPLPKEVFDRTYKACKHEHIFLQKYELGILE